MQTKAQLKEWLDFYVEAGVDEVMGETPVDHFNLPVPDPVADPVPAAAPKSQHQSVPRRISTAPAAPVSAPISNSQAIEDARKCAADCATIEELRAALAEFEGCSLKKLATHSVFARGNPQSGLMIIDRPPASEEDRTGLPLAGNAGLLFDKMLASIDVQPSDIYIASCLPWRPPGGRAPTPEEQAICLPFIRRHIELISPHTLLLCGEAAAFLLEKKTGINRLRGTWQQVQIGATSIPALAIFHPSFLGEHPASKKQAWRDLLALKTALAEKS